MVITKSSEQNSQTNNPKRIKQKGLPVNHNRAQYSICINGFKVRYLTFMSLSSLCTFAPLR